jgi:hypothetical protein
MSNITIAVYYLIWWVDFANSPIHLDRRIGQISPNSISERTQILSFEKPEETASKLDIVRHI